MSQATQLNTTAFWSRIDRVISAWTNANEDEDFKPFSDMDAILILSGDPPADDEAVKKSTAFQTWLLGYEFPSTIILLQKDQITFLGSPSKMGILQQLEVPHASLSVKRLTHAPSKNPSIDSIPELVSILGNSKRVGTPLKEKHTGKVADAWTKALAEKKDDFEFIDVATVLSTIMAPKDEDELKSVRTASHLASTLLNHYFMPRLEVFLDRQAVIKHSAIADQIEARLGSGDGKKGPDMKVFSKSKHLNDVDYSLVEVIYNPVIQSRGTKSGYDLKPSAESSEDELAHTGAILVSIGIKYKGYCAQVGRTFLIDPPKETDDTFMTLLALQQELLSVMRDGTPAKDVYAAAVNFVKEKKPALEKKFVKNVGFGMGLEFRDSAYLLNAKNNRIIRSDMIFNLSIGFQDLEDKNGPNFALGLSDTVKITANGAVCLTEGCKTPDEFLFFFDDDQDAPKSDKKKAIADVKPKTTLKSKAPASTGKANGVSNKVAGSKVLRAKTRQQFLDPDTAKSVAAKIAEHQRELHAQRLEDGIARFAGEDVNAGEERGKGWKRFVSYKGEAGLPKEVEALKIYVDRKAQTIVLPINGFAVPFHVNTLKNVSKNDEGDYTYLRINFQTPGQLAGKKEDTPFEDPDATFIRSLSYRSSDNHRFDALHKQITELKKDANKREQEKKEMADVIEQDNLIEIKGRRPIRLPDVFVRPALDGKRLPGELEIHSNGLRYQSPLGQKIDLLFSNIKHLFFQPCDGEMLVIIHFHLKSPIMIGKKKAKDVQVYREASDVQFDETGNRKRKYRYGDEDEIELEQTELKRRKALNKEFKHFAEKIAEASGDRLEVDIPFRELAFEGVPGRTNVRLQPTTDCLVYLSDPPFLVVTLADIEIASLERVQFSLKQFDLVLIFRDFAKTPLHINSIPSNQLDNVKEWLNSVEIPIAEGSVNLNWSQIMKTINDNPYEFFKDGGWGFLIPEGGSDAEADDDSESESDFEADVQDFGAESSESEGSDFDGSDASDDQGSEEDFASGDSSGDDWDTLEKKAAKSDKRREEGGAVDSDDDDRHKKKKAQSNGKSSGGGKSSGKSKR